MSEEIINLAFDKDTNTEENGYLMEQQKSII